jgi:hypothetical protein
MNDLGSKPAEVRHEDEELASRARRALKRAGESSWEAADCFAELSRRGWGVRRIAEACGTNRQSVSLFIRCAECHPRVTGRPPFWDAYASVRPDKQTPAQLLSASNSNEWFTPGVYLDAARRTLGGVIDLDVASCEAANATVKATTYYTKADDGLAQEWSGRVWCNPPYGGLAGDFTSRLVEEYRAGRVQAAVLLVNSHCTDTGWFQPLWDYPLCFTSGRVNFVPGDRDNPNASTHGGVFAYLGDDVGRFKEEFQGFGPVVKRIP